MFIVASILTLQIFCRVLLKDKNSLFVGVSYLKEYFWKKFFLKKYLLCFVVFFKITKGGQNLSSETGKKCVIYGRERKLFPGQNVPRKSQRFMLLFMLLISQRLLSMKNLYIWLTLIGKRVTKWARVLAHWT